MPPAPASNSGIVIPNQPRWHQRLIAFILYFALRFLGLTLRCRWTDRSGYFTDPPPGPANYCIWHNRLALSMHIYFAYIHKRNRSAGLAAMVSASRDGGFLAGVLERFGVQPVRGSTSRRGPQALRELTTWARRDRDLAITPDGPRGPAYVAQEGVIALAQLTGRPIIPVSWHANWKIRLRSWDRFQIPLPFSRVEFFFDKPIHVPRECTPADRETFRLQLETALKNISPD
jgi:lysophospholipid acyltransferase (LPLAT)-like uncharacterized protein